MAKEIDNFDDEEMDEANGAMLDALNAEENFVPQVRDYSDRRILIWEEDDVFIILSISILYIEFR